MRLKHELCVTHNTRRQLLGAYLECPMTLNVNQARGALKMPDRSYTTTCVSLVMSSTSIAAANAASEGIMCC